MKSATKDHAERPQTARAVRAELIAIDKGLRAPAPLRRGGGNSLAPTQGAPRASRRRASPTTRGGGSTRPRALTRRGRPRVAKEAISTAADGALQPARRALSDPSRRRHHRPDAEDAGRWRRADLQDRHRRAWWSPRWRLGGALLLQSARWGRAATPATEARRDRRRHHGATPGAPARLAARAQVRDTREARPR